MVERDTDGNLPPLKEKDLLPDAMIVFAAIVLPILFIFCVVTWYCRCQRRKRKAALDQQKMKPSMGRTSAGQSDRVDTEMPLASGRGLDTVPDTERAENDDKDVMEFDQKDGGDLRLNMKDAKKDAVDEVSPARADQGP